MDSTPETTVDRQEIVTNIDRPPLLSWGAIFAGLVFVVSLSWLLYLLGLALEVSIADVTDGEAFGYGLTTGAIVWIVLSSLIVYFVGSLLTARLSGKVDSTVGMLHGLTLWGLGTTVTLVLGYWGVTSLLQTGYSVLQTTAQATASAVSNTAYAAESAGANIGATVGDLAGTRLAENIQARIKRRASSVVARMESPGGANVTPEEVNVSIEALDAATLQKIAEHIVMGEITAARDTLANATELSNREVREIIQGIENEFEEELGTADNQTGLAGDIANSVKRQVADYVASWDAKGGPDVQAKEIRQALEQLDAQTLQTVAVRLVNGDVQGAKDSLTAATSLTTREVNDVIEGVNDDVSRSIQKYRQQANQTVETASSYAQGVLWTVFSAGALGLAVSLLGGWLGAETSRRLEVEARRAIA